LRWSLSSLSRVEGLRDGTHPLAARTCEPWPLAQARQIRPAAPVGALKLGPGRQVVRRTTRMASADSEVRPDPGPTLRPHHRKPSEAGPRALSTSSLPTLRSVAMYMGDDGRAHGLTGYACPERHWVSRAYQPTMLTNGDPLTAGYSASTWNGITISAAALPACSAHHPLRAAAAVTAGQRPRPR